MSIAKEKRAARKRKGVGKAFPKPRKKSPARRVRNTPHSSSRPSAEMPAPKAEATGKDSPGSSEEKKLPSLSGDGVERGFFRAEDGESLYYEVSGQGPAIAFCYGLVCRREHWSHQLEYFKDSHTLILFDYRGHHCSPIPKNDRTLTLDWCARDLSSLLTHLEIKDVVLFGHSLGVPIALKVALNDPRVRALGLICGAVSNPFQHMFYTDSMNYAYRFTEWMQDHAPVVSDRLWKWFTRVNRFNYLMTSQLGFHPEAAQERDVLSYMEGVHRTPFGVFQTYLRDYTRYDGRRDLGRLEIPSLMIGGEDDLVTPSYLVEEMGALTPGSDVHIIPQASHNAHADFPGEVNELLESFLKKVKHV